MATRVIVIPPNDDNLFPRFKVAQLRHDDGDNIVF